jgi:NAD(P)-dependent dehydrogenase (short-subunit alcohol dehydrogenase family)
MKTLLITGGTGGLGHAVVARLARDYRCAVLYRSAASWERLLKSVPAAAGIASIDELPRFAPVYGLVHLAGGFDAGSSVGQFRSMFETNLLSAVSAVSAVEPHLADGGRIVAISSAATATHPSGLAAYTASKAALNAYISTLAHELADRRITANALLPTALATPAMRANAADDQLVPLERVADWIAFLLSDSGAGVSGQLITLSASS